MLGEIFVLVELVELLDCIQMLHCVFTFFLAHDVIFGFFMIGGDILICICFLFHIVY